MRSAFRGMGVLSAALLATASVWSVSSATADEAVYVANANGPSVFQYAVQAGGLLARATGIAQDTERPDRIVLAPNEKSLYVAEGNTTGVGALLQYTVKPDGTLTPKSPATVTTEQEIEGLAISPDGGSLYVIEGGFFGSGQIATYTIGSDGTLSPSGAAKVSTGNQPYDIAVSPDGKSVYVSNWLESTISQYSVNGEGSLTPQNPATVATGPQPYRLAISPDGHSLYVTDEHLITEPSEAYGGWVSQFTVGADGTLTPKTPTAVSAGPEPKGIAISPDGENLYVADSTETGEISQFSIGTEGALTPLTPATIAAGRQPFGLALTLDGKYLYTTNSAEYTIGQYEIEVGGALKALQPETARAGEWPMSIVIAKTESEPPIAPEEPETKEGREGTEPPPERCDEPPPGRCRKPEPPGPCHQPDPPPGRCCLAVPGEVELLNPDRCTETGQGAREPPRAEPVSAGSGDEGGSKESPEPPRTHPGQGSLASPHHTAAHNKRRIRRHHQKVRSNATRRKVH
jgi:DNA-binding beta-propeller fold protein YncE